MTPEEELLALEIAEVTDHVSEIMFMSYESPHPDCVLCKRGIALGIWKRYGVDDPFAPEDG